MAPISATTMGVLRLCVRREKRVCNDGFKVLKPQLQLFDLAG